jgi:hypothetical protein
MGLNNVLATAAAFAIGAVALPAAAQTVKADAAAVSAVLKDKGMTDLEVSKGSDGDPMITGVSDGTKFLVFFYGCTNGANCESIQFYTGFMDTKMDAAKMNEWNAKYRFTRAYIDDEDDPVIQMDIDMAGGMPRALLADNIEFWQLAVSGFQDFVYPDK